MMSARPRWSVVQAADPDTVRALSATLNLPTTLAALLVQRGYASPDRAKQFLRPSLEELSDPFSLKDMDKAVKLIADAIHAHQTILVHGDYDVDGQCASALLTRVIRMAGGSVVPFVPHRLRDGYDFGPAGLAKALEHSATLIVTCDCGTSAHDTIVQAKRAGVQVIVTDHHLPRELPPADAVVNPRRPDCESELGTLCGTGVVFKLVQALCTELRLSPNLPFHFLDLVALATVADIVPLVGENRTLVRYGLKLMEASKWPGVRALLDVIGLAGRPIRAGTVGYVIAPRLNAAGRIGSAMDGLELLLSDDWGAAHARARELDTLNARRQEIDERILAEAVEDIEANVDLDASYALVLARESWHPGVIGIVASRVVERYTRPAVLVALEGPHGRGSGRSIQPFDLHAALAKCSHLLEKWGGHKQAAGLTVSRDRLDEFRSTFNDVARAELTLDDLIPTQRVDIVASVGTLDAKLERLMRYLEPCGPGNPGPVLGIQKVQARRPATVGTNHLRFTIDDGTGTIPAIGFGWADRVDEDWWREPVDVALRLDRNDWQGMSTLQARIVQIKSSN